jgi:SNF2 family DNA or RNA helicase
MRASELLGDFLGSAADELAREALTVRLASVLKTAPLKGARARRQTPADAWLAALAGEAALDGDPTQLAQLHEQYRAWTSAGAGEPVDSFRICFRLNPPAPADTHGSPEAPWTLDYLLQATDDPSLLVPAREVWRHRGATARLLNRRLDNPQERLLAGLGRATRLFAPIERSLQTATPDGCELSAAEAYSLIREGAMLLQASGFGVLIPALQTKLGLRLRLGSKAKSNQSSASSLLNWERLVDYDWQLAIGDETLSRAEFETLAQLKEPLVQIRGRWIELQPELVEQALALFRRQDRGEGLSLEEALRLALAPDNNERLPVVEVETAGWIDDLLRGLREGGGGQAPDEPPGFEGRLRPYQKAGVAWLATLARYGVGACLADDMGLGKTVQLIALLLHQRTQAGGSPDTPTLLICPTSVVGNWRHELARFAPNLRVLVHHGAGRTRSGFVDQALQYDIVISTYALLHRDEDEFAAVEWGNIVLDEAQNIKNSATRAAQVARRLHAGWRVALTGTPIENRLSDLWSLFHFLDPGYLGTNEEFRRRFAGPIERAGDAAATARLKALVSPLILRRLKTDRSILDDLPEKNEMKVFCTLTREQATLYQAVLRDSMRQVEEAEGIERRGLILAMIAKLKQTCDHPALLLKDGSALHGRSGKLDRLTEMLEEVTALGDRALIFTQYAQMGALLQSYLEAALSDEVLFLHGGTPVKQRDRLVARFQEERGGPPVFILSIKAGGTGLNLTRANHVFHFDRWWNPAVENQATDRAFRIGQRKDVQVHKFICAGTFEEAIDELIERKIALSQSIVGTSETWITEMSTEQLRDLFALREDAVAVG